MQHIDRKDAHAEVLKWRKKNNIDNFIRIVRLRHN